jgi:phenylpropionate dioxygenase-like ring-hydroxylating dioxygenase large terminal subunit
VNAWIDVAAASEVDTRPRPVLVGRQPAVVLRFRAGGEVRAFADHCPHRLVPLAAAGFGDGVLRCAYHGWEFDETGACVALPSAGPDATPPPRSRLQALAVRESGGRVLVQPDPAYAPAGPWLTNLDPALARAWHPIALGTEVTTEAREIRLLGDGWRVRRGADGTPELPPGAYAITERWGLVWLAPREPLVELFDDPDDEDSAYVGAWLPPARTNVSAGIVADNFLDVAHFPFVHVGTFGAGEAKVVDAYDVIDEPSGCRSIQVQWFDNPEDPGVRAGHRPIRQRRRATYIYRAPFQLMLRLEELDAGAVKTILFFAQPEDLHSTRIYTKMLLHGIGGVQRPGPETVAAEVAFEEAVLAEDLALQRHMTITGLPLEMRSELHVRADRLGVALRRILAGFLAAAC